MNSQRLETSRLFHRFGFGPRPGEYALAIKESVEAVRTQFLTVPTNDLGAEQIPEPESPILESDQSQILRKSLSSQLIHVFNHNR